MKGTIENRDSFLQNIAEKLNHKMEDAVAAPEWENQPQWAVYENYSPDQLIDVMKKAGQSIHTEIIEAEASNLAGVLEETIGKYGGGSVVATKDHRFADLGLEEVLKQNQVYVWDYEKGNENIDRAARANIGISICDVLLAESASAGLFNDRDKARSVSLLPVTSIVIVPKSRIVPRLTQAMDMIQEKVSSGREIANYINFISGPSNSADIEMRLVVGVHGPVKVAYIIVTDR